NGELDVVAGIGKGDVGPPYADIERRRQPEAEISAGVVEAGLEGWPELGLRDAGVRIVRRDGAIGREAAAKRCMPVVVRRGVSGKEAQAKGDGQSERVANHARELTAADATLS